MNLFNLHEMSNFIYIISNKRAIEIEALRK